jgi:hypothetical protein
LYNKSFHLFFWQEDQVVLGKEKEKTWKILVEEEEEKVVMKPFPTVTLLGNPGSGSLSWWELHHPSTATCPEIKLAWEDKDLDLSKRHKQSPTESIKNLKKKKKKKNN